MLMPTSTLAIVGIGNTSTSAKQHIAPINNFFIFSLRNTSWQFYPHQDFLLAATKSTIPPTSAMALNILHPRRVKTRVKRHFIGFHEQVHRPPKHPEMIRFQMNHKVTLRIPFLKKKEAILILDPLAEVAASASLLHPDGTGQ
jgi:hypothetical protein